MKISKRKWAVGSGQWTVLLIAAVLLVGCGGVDRPATIPTTGTVTIDGTALTSGSVVFRPEKGQAATGMIQPDGSFTLTTYEKNDGAVLGLHHVAVICRESQDAAAQEAATQGEVPLGKSLIPAYFANPDTSGLTVTITEDSPPVELKLVTKPETGE